MIFLSFGTLLLTSTMCLVFKKSLYILNQTYKIYGIGLMVRFQESIKLSLLVSRGAFRTRSSIHEEALCENSQWLLAIYYFSKKALSRSL